MDFSKQVAKYNHVIILVGFSYLLSSCSMEKKTERLPILGNSTIENQGNSRDTIYHTISEFSFVDQDSSVVTHDTYKGKIYIADFFFTSCPTICIKMKSQMLRVYDAYKDDASVMILSHTIDPKHDTIPLLKSYAESLGVSAPKWRFVTGPQEDIYQIGQESYMVSTAEDKFSPGGFMHSGAFILVDKEQRIRGIYDGTQEDQVDKLIKDIAFLLQEYN